MQLTATTGPVIKQPIVKLSPIQVQSGQQNRMQPLAAAVAQQLRTYSMNQARPSAPVVEKRNGGEEDGGNGEQEMDFKEFVIPETEETKRELRIQQLKNLSRFNQKHCDASPIYGDDLRDCMQAMYRSEANVDRPWTERSHVTCLRAMLDRSKCEARWPMELLKTVDQRTEELKPIFEHFVAFVPSVSAPTPILHVSHPHPAEGVEEERREIVLKEEMAPNLNLLHPIMSAMSTQVSGRERCVL